MKMSTVLTVMTHEGDTVEKYTGLEPFSQLSACLSRTGPKQAQAHLEKSFLSLVTSAFLLKE